MVRILKLALLVNDVPMPAIVEACGDYPAMFQRIIQQAVYQRQVAGTSGDTLEVQWKLFDAQQSELPAPEESFDGLLLTGSRCSANSDLPWVNELREYVRGYLEKNKGRVIGTCFGHQLLTNIFGQEIQTNPQGWEVGLIKICPTVEGKETQLFHHHPYILSNCVHKDIPAGLPKGFVKLAFSEKGPTQLMMKGDRILSMQFHPEMPNIFIDLFLHKRALPQGWLTEAEVEQSMETLREQPTPNLGEMLLNFILHGKI